MNTYEKIFQDAPISIWEEDWSKLKIILDSLRDKVPIDQMSEYLSQNKDILYMLAESIKVTRVNKKTIQIYEAENEAQFKTSISKTFCAESFIAFKEEIVYLYSGKKEFETEALTKTFKGKDLYVVINVKMPEDSDDYKNVILTMMDITPSKIDHKDHFETKAKFHRAFYQGVIGMGIADIQGNILDVNESFCSFLGYSKEELTCMNVIDLETAEDKFNTMAIMSKLLRNEAESMKFESKFIKKNGENVWGMIGYSLIRDMNNHPLYFVSQVIDVDKEKRNYITLNKNLQKYKSLLESTGTLYLITNGEGDIKDFSPKFHEFMACEPRLVEHRTFRSFVSAESMSVYDEAWGRLKQGQNVNCVELLLVKNSVPKWVSINASMMSNGESSVFIIITDITERKVKEFKSIIEREKSRDKLRNNIKGLRDKIRKIGNND
jgi:PAS domain S-box-containing protein